MNYNKEAKSLTFRRGSEVSQVRIPESPKVWHGEGLRGRPFWPGHRRPGNLAAPFKGFRGFKVPLRGRV